MANHVSAIKRHRQSIKARSRNRIMKTKVKNAVKDVREAIEAKDKDKAVSALNTASSVLNKAASKKIIHKRNAARKVSRLSKAVGTLG